MLFNSPAVSYRTDTASRLKGVEKLRDHVSGVLDEWEHSQC